MKFDVISRKSIDKNTDFAKKKERTNISGTVHEDLNIVVKSREYMSILTAHAATSPNLYNDVILPSVLT